MFHLRFVLALAQAVTVLVTWELWQPRTGTHTPNLPIADLPQLPFGEVLLLSLLLVVWRPRLGIAVHLGVLAVAMLFDQIREQPQVFSMALLLLATWSGGRFAGLARIHLSCLWLFSGAAKLSSDRFLAEGGEWLASGLGLTSGGATLAVGAGVVELLLGALLWWRRCAPQVLWLGAAVHLGIFTLLVSLGTEAGNVAVWPWNLVLVAVCLILVRREPASGVVDAFRQLNVSGRVLGALLLMLPLGYSAGIVDSMFSHRLYTLSHPTVAVMDRDAGFDEIRMLDDLRVALPKDRRIVTAWFRSSARPGESLVFLERRWLASMLGSEDAIIEP